MLEGAQGFSLGIQSGFYPYVTSRECTPAQMLSDCAVPHNYLLETIGVLRTYPIRVANRFDEAGNMVGYSGPGYGDQWELQWSTLRVGPELTTVTKLPRRVFSFSDRQLRYALRACAPDSVFLNFCNYMKDRAAVDELVHRINLAAGDQVVHWLGHGPTVNHVEALWRGIQP